MLRQCLGHTKKGTRCLIKVALGTMCHHHINQKRPLPPPPPTKPFHTTTKFYSTKTDSPKPESYKLDLRKGYIYVYTMALLLAARADADWLKTRNLVRDAKYRDQWVPFNAKKLDVMLVKVGMTTKTVAARIAQWELKCNHKLVCLYPDSHKMHQSLSDRLKLLSLHKKPLPTFATFDKQEKGFFVPKEVYRAEREIHGILKAQFGRGQVHCTGCVEKAAEDPKKLLDMFRKKPPAEPEYNVHVEWFPIPRKKLTDVYHIIDSICMKHAVT